jgi:hypothetical protein
LGVLWKMGQNSLSRGVFKWPGLTDSDHE